MLPMGRHGPAFLAYPNFKAFLGWNSAYVYSTTVAYFATRLAGAPVVNHAAAKTVQPLTTEQMVELQKMLTKRGYDVGEADGKLGNATRSAVKKAQLKLGLPANSWPTPELLAASAVVASRPTSNAARFVACHDCAARNPAF